VIKLKKSVIVKNKVIFLLELLRLMYKRELENMRFE